MYYQNYEDYMRAILGQPIQMMVIIHILIILIHSMNIYQKCLDIVMRYWLYIQIYIN